MNNGTPHSKRFPEQSPVEVDCSQVAFEEFADGDNVTDATFKWYRKDSLIVDNSTVRNIAIGNNGMTLLIQELTIASGAEDGTEGQYSCRFCLKKSCHEASIELIAHSPPRLECSDPTSPDISSGFVNLPVGCHLCIEQGESVLLLTLACQPATNRQPTYCTIRNPDGFSAQELDDGDSFLLMSNTLAISNALIANPEDPDPPTILGIWMCTCTNSDGNVTAFSKIFPCCELYVNKLQA
jgi:hypothetical protein